jgi:hypothetical protein
MSKPNTEERGPAERGVSSPTPAEIFEELRQEFAPITLRLTPEVEPAVVFRLEPYKREAGS